MLQHNAPRLGDVMLKHNLCARAILDRRSQGIPAHCAANAARATTTQTATLRPLINAEQISNSPAAPEQKLPNGLASHAGAIGNDKGWRGLAAAVLRSTRLTSCPMPSRLALSLSTSASCLKSFDSMASAAMAFSFRPGTMSFWCIQTK